MPLSEIDRASLRNSFQGVQQRIVHLLDYARAAIPILQKDLSFSKELCDSLVLLTVVRLEAFFVHVLSLGTRHREEAVRKHFVKNGVSEARDCSLPALVAIVRRKVSFEKGGKRLDGAFRLVFGRTVWASPEVRDVILDLVLLRNFIVHNDSADWSQEDRVLATYAVQFRTADVLTSRKYGEFTVHQLDSYKALLFIEDAILALVEQLNYLQTHIVQDLTWVDR